MKKDKFVIIMLVLVIGILIYNLVFSITELIDYNKRKESGNARWEQVEERIVKIEKEVDTLKIEVEQWKK